MGVSYLLDTHVLLWLLGEPARIPERIRSELAKSTNHLIVSAACALEISTKVRLGKLDAQKLVDTWPEQLTRIGAEELAVTSRHAVLAGSMTWQHRDPFDRLLVAQSMIEGFPLVTSDARIRAESNARVLAW